MEPNLSQALHLINGETTGEKIQQGGLIDRRLKDKKEAKDIVEELYVRCLSRKPTPQESTALGQVLDKEPDKKKALEDIFWALLNSREFMFNH